MELILTGRHFDAAEAVALGVINQRCNDGGAMATARALAAQLLENSPSAIRASKEALNRLEELESLEEAMAANGRIRSEEHTSELQSLMRISYAVFCLKKKKQKHQ